MGGEIKAEAVRGRLGNTITEAGGWSKEPGCLCFIDLERLSLRR